MTAVYGRLGREAHVRVLLLFGAGPDLAAGPARVGGHPLWPVTAMSVARAGDGGCAYPYFQ